MPTAGKKRKEPVLIHSRALSTPPHIVIGIDPGMTTGWAQFTDGVPTGMDQIYGLDALTDFVEEMTKPDLIVMEKYALWKWLALQQSGSKMEVAQAEGIVKSYARRNRLELVEQAPNILGTAKLWTKVDHAKGSHDFSHWKSAYNHAAYYLITHNMMDIVT